MVALTRIITTNYSGVFALALNEFFFEVKITHGRYANSQGYRNKVEQ
jgi:hypothetical protein